MGQKLSRGERLAVVVSAVGGRLTLPRPSCPFLAPSARITALQVGAVRCGRVLGRGAVHGRPCSQNTTWCPSTRRCYTPLPPKPSRAADRSWGAEHSLRVSEHRNPARCPLFCSAHGCRARLLPARGLPTHPFMSGCALWLGFPSAVPPPPPSRPAHARAAPPASAPAPPGRQPPPAPPPPPPPHPAAPRPRPPPPQGRRLHPTWPLPCFQPSPSIPCPAASTAPASALRPKPTDSPLPHTAWSQPGFPPATFPPGLISWLP